MKLSMALLFMFIISFQPAHAAEWAEREIEAQGKTYTIKELIYDKPVYLKPVTKDKSDYSNPARAAYSLYSAIKRYDYDWWLSSWTPEDQKVTEDRNKQRNRDASFWVNIWKKASADEQIRFIAAAQLDGSVLIAYEMVDGTGKVTFRSASAFQKQDSGEWKATQSLSSHPIFFKWSETLK